MNKRAQVVLGDLAEFFEELGSTYLQYRPENEQASKEEVVGAMRLCTMHGVSSGTWLEACCGYGRHVRFLAEAGWKVIGVDAAKSLLNARIDMPVGVQMLQADLRDSALICQLPSHGRFDVASILGTSFGLFGGRAADRTALSNLVGAMRAGGIVLLELYNPSYEARALDGGVEDSISTEDGHISRFRMVTADAREKHIRLRYSGMEKDIELVATLNLYSGDEIDKLSEQCGADLIACYGNLNGEVFSSSSSRRLVVALRRR